MSRQMIVAAMVGLYGCGAGAGSEARSVPVSSECCNVNGSVYCAGPSTVVQWMSGTVSTWSDRPDEVATNGECTSGEACTAYTPVDGGIAVIGNGVCP